MSKRKSASKGENEAERRIADVAQEQYPCCDIAEWWHEVVTPGGDPRLKKEMKDKLLTHIKQNDMAMLYRRARDVLNWTVDEKELAEMEEKHKKELETLEAKIEEAAENYGDQEVRDALLNKANFYARVGDQENAVSAYKVAYEKTVGMGGRLDISLTLIRIGFVHADRQLLKDNITSAKKEMETGGDWERRNKLKVFEGLELIRDRKFDAAAKLFLSVLPAFPTTALLNFEKFIFYASLLALMCCSRQELREQVVFAPPILEGSDEILMKLIKTFYAGQYRDFFTALVPIARKVQRDIYMGRHYLYFIRCIRLRVYRQFLEPYKSVTIQNMAEAFGVSATFIEDEVAGFIASGKLSCRINKVCGIIESNRPDERSRLYLQVIKEGDILMNRIQRLARVIAL